MNVIPFRLYGNHGCPHCVAAEQFLNDEKLPTHLIPIQDDPIILEGIFRITGVNNVPVLVSFINDEIEIIRGFKESEYKRIAEIYRARLSTSAPNQSGAERRDSGQAANVAGQQIHAVPSPA